MDSYIYRGNLIELFQYAITQREQLEKEWGYFNDSVLLSAWKENLAALIEGKLEIRNDE